MFGFSNLRWWIEGIKFLRDGMSSSMEFSWKCVKRSRGCLNLLGKEVTNEY